MVKIADGYEIDIRRLPDGRWVAEVRPWGAPRGDWKYACVGESRLEAEQDARNWAGRELGRRSA